ncbi:MAG: type II secretion system protein [Phycisphaerae bacterium]
MSRVAHHTRHGFTLIEVLVVVAILATLIAILLPSLSNVRARARRTVCLSNLHQQCLGFAAYAADHKHKLPLHGGTGYSLRESDEQVWGRPRPGTRSLPVNAELLYGKYCGKEGVFFYCPSNLERNYDDPSYGWVTFKSPGPVPDLTWGGHMYAMSVRPAHAPSDDGTLSFTYVPGLSIYGDSWGDYKQWQQDYRDTAEPPGEERVYFGKQQALLYDNPQVIPHTTGHNVAFTDYHAKRVTDPHGFVKAHFPSSPDVRWDLRSFLNRCWVHSFLSRRQ